MAHRHTGQWELVAMSVSIHCWQKVACPQGNKATVTRGPFLQTSHDAILMYRHTHCHQFSLSCVSVYFWKTNTTRPTTKQVLTIAIAVCVHSQCLVKLSEERKFLGTKEKTWERKFLRTKGPGNESSQEFSFPGNESSRERKVSGTKVPHRDYSFLGTKGLGHEKSRYHATDSCI